MTALYRLPYLTISSGISFQSDSGICRQPGMHHVLCKLYAQCVYCDVYIPNFIITVWYDHRRALLSLLQSVFWAVVGIYFDTKGCPMLQARIKVSPIVIIMLAIDRGGSTQFFWWCFKVIVI